MFQRRQPRSELHQAPHVMSDQAAASTFRLRDLLGHDELGFELLAGGADALDRRVAGAHAIEIERPATWLEPEWIMLTTGAMIRIAPSKVVLLESVAPAPITTSHPTSSPLIIPAPHRLWLDENLRAIAPDETDVKSITPSMVELAVPPSNSRVSPEASVTLAPRVRFIPSHTRLPQVVLIL